MARPTKIELVGRLQNLRTLLPQIVEQLAQAEARVDSLQAENRRLRKGNARLNGRRSHDLAAHVLHRERSGAEPRQASAAGRRGLP